MSCKCADQGFCVTVLPPDVAWYRLVLPIWVAVWVALWLQPPRRLGPAVRGGSRRQDLSRVPATTLAGLTGEELSAPSAIASSAVRRHPAASRHRWPGGNPGRPIMVT